MEIAAHVFRARHGLEYKYWLLYIRCRSTSTKTTLLREELRPGVLTPLEDHRAYYMRRLGVRDL
jgi:hypothetical protein